MLEARCEIVPSGVTMGDGRMTYEQFLSASATFMKRPPALNDGWKLELSDEYGHTYLSISKTRKVPNPNCLEVGEPSTTIVDDVLEDSCTSSVNSTFQIVNCKYDVVYSVSHSVPVLYFNVSKSSGQCLDLEDVLKLFGFSGVTGESLWNVLTMQDHPVLQTPYFCVHPCNNWQVLKELCPDGDFQPERFLISWLSIVGSQFGLTVSPSYFLV